MFRRFIFVSCHRDYLPLVNIDWCFDCGTQTFHKFASKMNTMPMELDMSLESSDCSSSNNFYTDLKNNFFP